MMREWREERGVTLLELLVVLVLVGSVFGAVTAFATSTMASYHDTATRSRYLQEATEILSQLAQDIRRSDAGTWVLQGDLTHSGNHAVTFATTQPNDPTQQAISVTYQQDGTKIIYRHNDRGITLTLADQGSFSLLERADSLELHVIVGALQDPLHAELTTSVTRYDWGQ